MDKEEILQAVRMPEVLSRYGLKVNRTGMISCPFHGRDRHPSMKIYKDGFKCFTCGEYGNVIDFVMRYEGCDFKTAFISLGGSYATTTEREREQAKRHRERTAAKRQRVVDAEQRLKQELSYCIALCRKGTELEPLSDEWCFSINKLQVLLNNWQCKYINGEEIDESNVLRICGQVRRYFNIAG